MSIFVTDCASRPRFQAPAQLFFAQPLDAKQFVTRPLTRLQQDRMSRNFQFLGDKAQQCRVRFPFYRRCAQFDLNCPTVLTYDAVALGMWNDVNSQNGHGADHIRAEMNCLDEFSHRVPSCGSETATLVPHLLYPRIQPALLAICAMAIGA